MPLAYYGIFNLYQELVTNCQLPLEQGMNR